MASVAALMCQATRWRTPHFLGNDGAGTGRKPPVKPRHAACPGTCFSGCYNVNTPEGEAFNVIKGKFQTIDYTVELVLVVSQSRGERPAD